MATKKAVKEIKKTRKPKAPTALDKIDEKIAELKATIEYGEIRMKALNSMLKCLENVRSEVMYGTLSLAAQEAIVNLL